MSNYNNLKSSINNNIYENQTQQITGTVLNAILNEMTNALGAGYQFAGVATVGMTPSEPDARIFYLAGEGIYTSFDGIQVPAGKLGILKWDNRWHLETIDGLGSGGANLTGYVTVASTDDLPDEGVATLGYLCGENLYLYVGEGGDTKEGKYQNCGSFRGPQGDSVQDVEQTQTSLENGGVNKIKFTLSNGISCEFQVRNGTTSSGLFPTLAALQAAYPSPVVGQYAFVGAGFPADIYVCTTAGTWTDSGEDYDGDNVDLTDYATKAEVNQLEAEVTELDGQVNGVQGGEETVVLSFTDGIYCAEQADNTIDTLSASNLSLITINDVRGGEKYRLKLNGSYTGGLLAKYFIFAKTDTVASIPVGYIPNYVSEIDTTNHIYEFTIPEETTKFLSACLKSGKSSIYAKKIVEERKGLEEKTEELAATISGIVEGENTITGKQIDGTSVVLAEDEITPIFTDGEYRAEQSNGSISAMSASAVSLIEIDDVTPGDFYDINIMMSVSANLYPNYFIFAKTDTQASIPKSEIANYVTLIDATNYVYRIVIPNGTTKFYSACRKADKTNVWVKKLTLQKVLEWLRVEGRNLAPTIFDTCISTVFATIEKQNASLHLWDSIKRPFNLSGKTLVAFGDSITAGVSSPGLVTITDCYIKLFANYAGATLNNQAVSGSTLVHQSSSSIIDKVTGFTGTADAIIIAGGTNDWNQGKAIGTFGDTENTTVYGAMDGICSFLKTNYPNADVIFITPIPYTKPASSFPNHIAPLDEYRNAIYDVATYYGFSVVSGLGLGMPRELGGWNNTMVADSDGCHPTALGHALYARSLAGKLL